MSNQGYGGPGDPHPPAGDPQYPTETTVPPRTGAGATDGNRGLLIGALSAVIVAGLVVFVLAVSGVFGATGTTSADKPEDVVRKLMDASQKQDLDAVKQVVCEQDLDDPDIDDVVSDDGHATAYSIGGVTQDGDDRATVDVAITTPKGPDSAKLPVIKENGAWKVCLSEIDGSPTDFPSRPSGSGSGGSSSAPPSSDSSSGSSFCASVIDAQSTARLFISYITLGNAQNALGCVAPGTLDLSDIQALMGDGKLYSPTLPSSETGPDFSVTSSDGKSTLSFRVEKQSDGKYYVVSASD